MKKDNKGFTIIELVCVMIILTIILLLAYPNISKLTKITESKYDANFKSITKSAAKIYVSNNKEEVDDYLSNNPKYCIPLAKLAAYDYLDTNLKDFSDKEINMRQCVNVSKDTINDKIKYKYELSDVDFVDESTDYIPPVLTLRNKQGSTTKCSFVMTVSSKEHFNEICEVIAEDNVTTNIDINMEEKTNTDSVILKYMASDEAGNKAIPIKIKLIIE